MAPDFIFWDKLDLLQPKQVEELKNKLAENINVSDIETVFFTALTEGTNKGLTRFHVLTHQMLFLGSADCKDIEQQLLRVIFPAFHQNDNIELDKIKELINYASPTSRSNMFLLELNYINYLLEKYNSSPDSTKRKELLEQFFKKNSAGVSVFNMLIRNEKFLTQISETLLVECFMHSPLEFVRSCGRNVSLINNQNINKEISKMTLEQKIELFECLAQTQDVDQSARFSSDAFIIIVAKSLIADLLALNEPSKIAQVTQNLSNMNLGVQKKLSKCIQHYLDTVFKIDLITFDVYTINNILDKVCFGSESGKNRVLFDATLKKGVLKQLFILDDSPLVDNFSEILAVLAELAGQLVQKNIAEAELRASTSSRDSFVSQSSGEARLRKTFLGEAIEKVYKKIRLDGVQDTESEKAWKILEACKKHPSLENLINIIDQSKRSSESASSDSSSPRTSLWDLRDSMYQSVSGIGAASPASESFGKGSVGKTIIEKHDSIPNSGPAH